METVSLREYRCKCGKLLFKGVLMLGVVEVKCRRCGAIFLQEELEPEAFTLLECDGRLQITDVSGYVEAVFGRTHTDIIGEQLGTFFPLLRDGEARHAELTTSSERTYTLRENTLLLQDGNSIPLHSYFIPKREGDTLSGYRMLNWVDTTSR